MLGPAERRLDHPSSILYFRVSDLTSSHQRLVDAGVPIVAPPRLIAPMPTYDLWMSAFRDSEGNIHQLMSEKSRAQIAFSFGETSRQASATAPADYGILHLHA